MRRIKDNLHDEIQFLWKTRQQWRVTLAIASCLLMGGLLTGCTATPPATHAAPQRQEQMVVQETTNDTSESETSEVAARLGVFVDSSMKVVAILSQAPAERGGIQVGDILQSFDGLSYAKEGEKIIDNLNREGPSEKKVHRLIVLRADKELQFAFDLTVPDNYVPPSPLPTPVPNDSGLVLY